MRVFVFLMFCNDFRPKSTQNPKSTQIFSGNLSKYIEDQEISFIGIHKYRFYIHIYRFFGFPPWIEGKNDKKILDFKTSYRNRLEKNQILS